MDLKINFFIITSYFYSKYSSGFFFKSLTIWSDLYKKRGKTEKEQEEGTSSCIVFIFTDGKEKKGYQRA